MRFTRSLIALGLAAGMSIAQADTTLSFKDERQAKPSSFLIKEGRILMQGQDPQGGQFASIYDSQKNHFIIIDYTNRNYYIMDKAMIDSQIKTMNQMRAQMEQRMQAQIQQMPEEQRAMMEQRMQAMLNPPTPPALRFEKTGRSIKVNGIECKQLNVYRGDNLAREVCVAEVSAVNMPDDDYATLKNMFSYMKEMAETFAKSSPMAGNEGALMADMDGIPVEMRDLQTGASSRLEGVSTNAINPELFKVPDGFTQIDPVAMMQQGMQQQQAPRQ
jgi:hypothetical protein